MKWTRWVTVAAMLVMGACHKPTPPVVIPPDPPVPPIVKVLPRLVASGHAFTLEDGSSFTVIGNNDHQLFEKYLNHPDQFEAVYAQRVSLGFNWLRVFSMCYDGNSDMGHARPKCNFAYDDAYYAAWPRFAERLAQDGIYLEVTVFGSVCDLMPDPTQQQDHWSRLQSVLRNSTNVLLELVNENSGDCNHIRTEDFAQPLDMVGSHGSNGSQMTPVRPWWGYETFHTNDAFEWWRKGGHNGMELSEGDAEGITVPSHVPVIEDEKTRTPDNDGSLGHTWGSAAAAALLIAGSSFHTNHGRFGELFDDGELALARAFVEGAKSVPLFCQNGPYRHRADLEGPADLRVYQRGFDDACIVRIPNE